jgi:hypothetical protein
MNARLPGLTGACRRDRAQRCESNEGRVCGRELYEGVADPANLTEAHLVEANLAQMPGLPDSDWADHSGGNLRDLQPVARRQAGMAGPSALNGRGLGIAIDHGPRLPAGHQHQLILITTFS